MLGEETLAGQVDMTMMLEKVEVKVVIMIGSPMTMEGGMMTGMMTGMKVRRKMELMLVKSMPTIGSDILSYGPVKK